MHLLIYCSYNLIYQIFSIWLLFYANTYLNDFLIPQNIKWVDSKLRIDLTSYFITKSIVLTFEFILLFIIIRFIDKWFLNKFINEKQFLIFNWTMGLYLIISFACVVLLIYSIFN